MNTRCMLKAGLMLVALAVGVMTGYGETAYWKDGGTGPFTDSSHWVEGKVPSEGWAVSFRGTTDAVVDDDAMDLFKSFTSIQLQGAGTRLTVRNNSDVTIQKGNAWFVSDGIVTKIGTGTLTLDHALHSTMVSVYGGFEVREGTLALVGNGNDATPACPIGVFAPGVLKLPEDKEVRFKGLYGDGHVVNPPSTSTLRMFVTSGTREAPHEFSGTFEHYPVRYYGDNGSCQRFLNPEVDIGGNVYLAYLGTAKFPSCVFRAVGEYEYLGTGETTSTDTVFLNNGTWQLTLNGGTNGALNVARDIYYNSDTDGNSAVGEIVWTGDSAQPNVFSGKQSVTGARPVYWKKTGTGTWRFTGTASRGNRGVVATERGRLEYDNMAEAGSASPLGTANNLLSEYYGSAVDESKRVSYAYLLGDGTNAVDATTATMAYIGSEAKTIKTRPVALKGAGRFEATTAALDWTGFTSAEEDGTNTLVLAGSAAGCVARDVTNGVGRIAVVKEGAGSWSVDGNFDFSAGAEARQGTLTLKTNKRFTWYKLTFTEFESYCWADQFVLLNDKGENQILGFSHNKSADGNVTALQPGEAAFGRTGFGFLSGNESTYGLANFFTDATDGTCLGGTFGNPPSVGPQYVVPVIVRLREGADPIVRYDIKSRGRQGWLPDRCPTGWTLEGSCDGVNWYPVDSKSGVTLTTTEHYWYSSNSTTLTGYGPFASEPALVRPASLDYVGASQGATLVTTAPITANGIRYDVALGGGTIDGFDLAAGGTLEILNQPKGASWNLPITFVHCTGSLDGWTVKVNGEIKKGYSAAITDEGITVHPAGMTVILK